MGNKYICVNFNERVAAKFWQQENLRVLAIL
jgi:hypothetical protein